ncbi:ATP-NAD kinase family protein [Pseudoteredinibacter isoporae]|uniref:Putative polyphosphate/ATP-dependent NAD kinase n=1 Tax=Pseudoteredinibacter isoporae TaxID=570281 RepID=A0A7X0JXL2_9GAMM|nr:ATP-NAD kinase family protein [Pseudoteredinibacter isoporae]MBB6523286.1 putative polyphosphate/ATP-dependent NAD kinase [Pseudoteredinibacter isoporae]NHO88800.1 ATP-NAD kinase family protein [Pseudoteredinibacter isoporae]NIB24492.1 ATP-NAD kinase family protein [Pseudoteredinibacter isoporae]
MTHSCQVSNSRFRLAFLLNPYAGLGGPEGLKGSDDISDDLRTQSSRSMARAKRALTPLLKQQERLSISAAPGVMGADMLIEMGFREVNVVGRLPGEAFTTAQDSERLAHELAESGIDLLLFVGGDGTARNIVNGLSGQYSEQVCLGIPAGVKMHSAVFAINPESAAEVLQLLLKNGLVDLRQQEVRDIDETLFRQGQVRSKYYGELWVPEVGHFVQQTKNSGREVEELVLADIAADIVERLDDERYYLIGPGSTPKAILDELNLEGTLLGFDVLHQGELIARDVNASYLETFLTEHKDLCTAIITAIGGQGHLLGRGNQQLSPNVLRLLGQENLWVVATKTKITELEQRPLLVDSNDAELDRALSGHVPVTTGYRDTIYYPISCGL